MVQNQYTLRMVRFICTRCGKCCMNFGYYIVIEREVGGGRVECRNRLDGEVFTARAKEPVKGSRTGVPNWCRFLEYDPADNRYSCRIYETRPRLCREYRCRRLEVLDSSGKLVGKLAGETDLATVDHRLSKLWNSRIKPLLSKKSPGWKEEVARELESAGYRVMIYE